MKKKFLCLITIGLFIFFDTVCILNAIGAVRKNRYDYEFIMNNSVVDGNRNGRYFYLDKGDVYISGTHYLLSTDDWGESNGFNSVSYVLCMSKFGPDKKIGSVSAKVDPDSQWHYTDYGPEGCLGYAEKSSSKYYLYIYKLDDGHNIAGSGVIYQND